jgi:hypothetical protein
MSFTQGQIYEYNGRLLVVVSVKGLCITFHDVVSSHIIEIRKDIAKSHLNSNILNPCNVETEIKDNIPYQHNDSSMIERLNHTLFENGTHVYFYNRHFSIMVNLSLGTVIRPNQHYPIYLSFKHMVNPYHISFEY